LEFPNLSTSAATGAALDSNTTRQIHWLDLAVVVGLAITPHFVATLFVGNQTTSARALDTFAVNPKLTTRP
jgi:hypothetical protein